MIYMWFFRIQVHLGNGNAKNHAIKVRELFFFLNNSSHFTFILYLNEHQIQKIRRHPKYSKRSGKNDIALIEVNEIFLTKDSWPACVETVLSDEMPNVKLNVTGWGSTSPERKLKIHHGNIARAYTK